MVEGRGGERGGRGKVIEERKGGKGRRERKGGRGDQSTAGGPQSMHNKAKVHEMPPFHS